MLVRGTVRSPLAQQRARCGVTAVTGRGTASANRAAFLMWVSSCPDQRFFAGFFFGCTRQITHERTSVYSASLTAISAIASQVP